MKKVDITEAAVGLIKKIEEKNGQLIFHQSGGCCDGSAPMLFPEGDMYLDETDILLGEVAGVPFYMNKDQYEYWKFTHLTIDIVEGRGASFSLEIPYGYRFLVRSRLFTDEEIKELKIQ